MNIVLFKYTFYILIIDSVYVIYPKYYSEVIQTIIFLLNTQTSYNHI